MEEEGDKSKEALPVHSPSLFGKPKSQTATVDNAELSLNVTPGNATNLVM